ncbi:MAG TPA: T9SS type A sorting domain-containing protein, partial [Chitinophagaceae bacterium]|nr:T9SS type A sorting domain-containing protein [Chitinophagaceae bacterium]
FLLSVLGVVFFSVIVSAQITTPIIKAGFGVDADLRTNFFNGFVQSGNDDWFNNGTAGTGYYVIDTTGAAAIVAGYLSDVSPWPKRMAPLYRSMSRPKFDSVNNRLWLDAIFVRDYHGNDSTVFTAGSDKNGMSPANWTGGVQGVPDKNDILDVFMHVRRAGKLSTDSLWMFGGISLDNTTGNRYFDFELYQSDIYYDRATAKFYGYGPDAGHTSWQLDAAGNVVRPGDIIFSAEYQSSTLTNIEARIWVDQATLSITPAQFSWSGQFDGATAGAQFGYASILPKTAGAFYTGLGSGNNTWAGPFQLVLQNNSLAVNYAKDQFMEFSVNLSKLGLDPVSLLGGDVCGSPFNKLVVKTRASASFTAELKDFVAPIDLFLAPRANITPEIPFFCGMTDTLTSDIYVMNPHSTSVYTWSTIGGNIVYTDPSGTWIKVNQPGTYIVTQRLLAVCNAYATDTVTIFRDSACNILPARFKSFSGVLNASDKKAELQWTVVTNSSAKSFVVEASVDGGSFVDAGTISSNANLKDEASYNFNYDIPFGTTSFVEFRIRMINQDGSYSYSRILRINTIPPSKAGITIAPNPVRGKFQISINSSSDVQAKIIFLDMQGRTVSVMNEMLKKGTNIFAVETNENWQPGIYNALLKINQETLTTRFVVLE